MQLFRALANLLEITNYSITFYIYCLFSKDFRNTLIRTLQWPWGSADQVNRTDVIRRSPISKPITTTATPPTTTFNIPVPPKRASVWFSLFRDIEKYIYGQPYFFPLISWIYSSFLGFKYLLIRHVFEMDFHVGNILQSCIGNRTCWDKSQVFRKSTLGVFLACLTWTFFIVICGIGIHEEVDFSYTFHKNMHTNKMVKVNV